MTDNTPDALDEILESMGQDFYPYSEFGGGEYYEDLNRKAIAEAKTALLAWVERLIPEEIENTYGIDFDVGWNAAIQEMKGRLK